MPNITVKNVPENVYTRLKLAAAANRRSINNEVIIRLERTLLTPRVNPEEAIAQARLLRRKTARYPITDEELTKAKSLGRP